MTTKEFFKSNAFKSLAVLIAIVLVAGALLAIFNDVLYISDEERLRRTLSAIYGQEVTAEEVTLSEEERHNNYGDVNAAYYIADDGNYLFQTTGGGGYSNGSVTLWTVIACTGTREAGDLALTGIDRVVYESNSGQTLISSLDDDFYAFFADNDALVASGGYFTAINGGTGDLNNFVLNATMSSYAASNAVNAALACFRTVFVTADEEADPVEEYYGESVAYETLTVSETDKTNKYGTVDAVYFVADKGQYLFRTTGTGGFQDGTVTLWTALTADAGPVLTGIDKVVYISNTNQSWMDKIEASFYDNFANRDALVADGGYFFADKNSSDELNNVTIGASRASAAACNAVNAALAYFRSVLAGGKA